MKKATILEKKIAEFYEATTKTGSPLRPREEDSIEVKAAYAIIDGKEYFRRWTLAKNILKKLVLMCAFLLFSNFITIFTILL